MSEANKIKELASHFKTLGVDDPESWAQSEIKEGIPQYACLIFLRAAWKSVVAEGNDSWIDNVVRNSDRRPNDPCSSAGPILEKMVAAGISKQDITELVRVMQYETLFQLCYLLSDSSSVEYPSYSLPQVKWALVQIDEAGKPIKQMDALHERVLTLDPTGREMGPRT